MFCGTMFDNIEIMGDAITCVYSEVTVGEKLRY